MVVLRAPFIGVTRSLIFFKPSQINMVLMQQAVHALQSYLQKKNLKNFFSYLKDNFDKLVFIFY